MKLLTWLTLHWLDLLQSISIVGGLLFTGIALRTDARSRRLQSLFAITKNHREIWSECRDRAELGRILDPKANLATKPITEEERMFVTFLILHLKTAYEASRSCFYIPPEALSKDIASFFSLPIPKAVWTKAKEFQDKRFVTFVEQAT